LRVAVPVLVLAISLALWVSHTPRVCLVVMTYEGGMIEGIGEGPLVWELGGRVPREGGPRQGWVGRLLGCPGLHISRVHLGERGASHQGGERLTLPGRPWPEVVPDLVIRGVSPSGQVRLVWGGEELVLEPGCHWRGTLENGSIGLYNLGVYEEERT